ncbi:MAG: serine/threonine protein kinase [Elusimicrobia bacterium]|nr:serine/threonine protein kinase [Elusimicrobiota bacterium]
MEEGKVLYRTARDLGRLQALSVERLRGPALQEYLSQALAEQDLERSTAAFDAFAAEFDRKAAEIATHAADGGPDSSFAKAGLKRLIELGLRFAREMACFLLQKGLPRDAGIGLDRFREHWGPEEYALRFEAFLLEGQESLAGAIFDKLKGLHEAREEAKLFYELGAAAERHGFPGLALRAYGHMIVEGADFADVKERHRTLAGGPGKTPAPIGSRAWPGDRDTTLAAPAPAAGGKRYERLRVIGEGGMGVVYEARDTLLGRKVAIKELKSELKARRREVARFLEEARIVARLQHPNIVAIHEVVQDEGEAFMVLELVRGEPLGERLDAQRLDWGGFLLLAEQICAAVDYAHSQGIIHRDIKPSNILVAGKSAVKLTDFGIARGVKDALSQLTGTVVKGTLSYMAPEQHYGESDARSDVYALGVTFYEMLAGELPFRGPDPLPPKKEMRYQPPSALGRPLPEGADGRRLDRVFERCFQVDPARRFPTVAELFKALSQTTDAVDAQATDGARPWRPA